MAGGSTVQSTTGAGHGTDIGTSTSNNTVSTPSEPSSLPQPSKGAADVEMTVLEASNGPATTGAGSQGGLLNDVSIPESSPIDASFSAMPVDNENSRPGANTNSATVAGPSSSTQPLSSTSNEASAKSQPTRMTRVDSEAIGPSTDVAPVITNDAEAGKVLAITLLLHTGARHPYKIDERYLGKRNVTVPETLENGKKDPYSISVYTLKELILREWREEWETQPSSPSSIRLIYFGRLLDDKTPLRECRFNEKEANVVHMTVRPQDMIDEEDAAKGKGTGRDRDGGEATAGCRCVIL